jgi:hypothetical protein
MRIIMKIQVHQESDSESMSESESDSGNPIAILKTLEEEITNFDVIFEKVQEHIVSFESRVKQLNAFGLTPLGQDISQWCEKKGLVAPFTLDAWFKAVLSEATTDLKTRMLYFKEYVPWSTKNMSVFDLLRGLPGWFTFSKHGVQASNNEEQNKHLDYSQDM